MKIRMYFGIVKTLIVVAVLLAGLAIVGLDIAMLAGADGIVIAESAVAGVSLAAAIIICAISLIVLLNSYYKFNDDYYCAMVGFFKDKFGYDSIVCVKQNSLNNDIFVVANVNYSPRKGVEMKEQEMAFKINVAPNKVDVFLSVLREKKGDLVVELFTPEKKEKNKK